MTFSRTKLLIVEARGQRRGTTTVACLAAVDIKQNKYCRKKYSNECFHPVGDQRVLLIKIKKNGQARRQFSFSKDGKLIAVTDTSVVAPRFYLLRYLQK